MGPTLSRWTRPVRARAILTHRGEKVKQPSRSLDEALQGLAPARMAELAQRLGLDLPDALARYVELLPDLLEGVIGVLADPEPPPQHLLLAVREGVQDLPDLVVQVVPNGVLEGRRHLLVLDEVAQVAVLLLPDGR